MNRPWLNTKIQEEVERRLEQRFGGDVELKSFTVSFSPTPVVVGEGLRVIRKGAPLISVRKLTAELGVLGLLRDPLRVSHVSLEGLEIVISHRGDREPGAPGRNGKMSQTADQRDRGEKPDELAYQFILDQVDADGTVLRILPRDPESEPLEWEMKKLSLQSAGLAEPMTFQAELTNAKPPGLIGTVGRFGPWNQGDPGGTPVSGNYRFADADLSVFGGISGHLASEGAYRGQLDRIEVDGTTETPDFTVSVGGHPVDLTTKFHAIVDGTNGDTELNPVRAHFMDSDIDARGSVARRDGEVGKSVRLKIQIEGCPVQDFLYLVLSSTPPPVKGAVTIKTNFALPPGQQDVVRRLRLDGSFSIKSAQFASGETQHKLENLSWRARGRPDQEKDSPQRVASDMSSDFSLHSGVASFSGLSFRVPGADVQLNGSHDLESGALAFKGKLRMNATLSQATGGIKSFFLKLVDPFFKKDGAGAVVPIKIGGTIDDPSFGLDL